jgi:hypothetical protein
MTQDPLLAALDAARIRKEEADQQIRLLLAYARELAAPRPYRLADLAKASGISISGVRTAYDASHTSHVIEALTPSGSAPFTRHELIGAVVNTLLSNS